MDNEKNPFRRTNSRFSKDIFFNDDKNIDNKNKREKKYDNVPKTDKPNEQKNVNTFLTDNTKPNFAKDKKEKREKQERRENFSRFSSPPKEEKKKDFEMSIEEFPELVCHKNTDNKETILLEKKFLDAVNTIQSVNEDDKDSIKPGWVVLSKNYDSCQINIAEGPLTNYRAKQLELQLLEETPKYIMENIHNALIQKWERNIVSYEAIHGEGSYQEVYYLPPVYDDFYNYSEDESDEEEDQDNYENDEYMERGWNSDYE